MSGLKVFGILVTLLSAYAPVASAQTVDGKSLGGWILPVVPAERTVRIESDRATGNLVDDTRRLTLEGRVKITIGDIKLRGNWVQVWINRVETGAGTVTQLAAWFEKLDQPSRTSSVVLRDGSVLVTATTTGEVTLDTGLLLDTPVQDPRLVVAERALARRLAQIAAGAAGAQQPQIGIEASPEILPVPTAEGPKGTNALPLVQPIGDVRLFAGTLEFNQGAERSEIVISRGLDLEVPANRGPIGSRLNLTARRAVLFGTPELGEAIREGRADASMLEGAYLEGLVRIRGLSNQADLHADRIWWDFQTGEAVVPDPVIRMKDDSGRPLTLVAEEVRRTAEGGWRLENGQISVSTWRDGHLAIASDRLEVNSQNGQFRFSTDNARLRVGGRDVGVPFNASGRLDRQPLRGLGIQNLSGNVVPSVDWNLPDDLGTGEIGTRFADGRGPGVTLDARTESTDLALQLQYDDGTDRTSAGVQIEPQRNLRGSLQLRRRDRRDGWNLDTKVFATSDPTWLSAWERNRFEAGPTTNSGVMASRPSDDATVEIEASGNLDGRVGTGWELASVGASTDRLPEFRHQVAGRAVAPGVLYNSSSGLGQLRWRLDPESPASRGLRGALIEGDPLYSFDAWLQDQGLGNGYVTRAHTRHEFRFARSVGPFRVVPFVFGGAAWWDGIDGVRDPQGLMGGGVEITTTLERIYEDVERPDLGLSRLRWLMEPSLTLTQIEVTGDSVNAAAAWDPLVEQRSEASLLRLSLDQRVQTKRGPLGDRRTHDVLELRTALVLHDTETPFDPTQPPRYDPLRPEYGIRRDHVEIRAFWNPGTSLSIGGEGIWDLDGESSHVSAGVSWQPTATLRTAAEYRKLRTDQTAFLDFTFETGVNELWAAAFRPRWNLDEGGFRAWSVLLSRTFPEATASLRFGRDQFRDELILGGSLQLLGQ
ncbi:MAG: hypothetical protein VXZ30_08180 [Planctomycetota bacterium]|nr:hypothetical protein [Planctomycetota bacterium]